MTDERTTEQLVKDAHAYIDVYNPRDVKRMVNVCKAFSNVAKVLVK